MDALTLTVSNRDVVGKKNRFLRRQGVTPAHLFGHNVESVALQCDTAQLLRVLARAGKTRLIDLKIGKEKEPRSVFVREIQRDAISRQLIHIDFYQVSKEEKITVDVPILLVGEAPAMRGKMRMLVHGVTSLSIECLPGNVPPRIEVDISGLNELEQPVYVKDIVLGAGITVHTGPEQLVVKVSEVGVREEEVVVEKVAAEVEAEGEVKAEGEGEAKPKAEGPAEEAPAKSAPAKPARGS